MKEALLRRLVVLALAGVLSVALMGMAPTEAQAITHTWIYNQIMSIKSQITSIKSVNSSQASSITSIKSVNSSQATAINNIHTVDAAQAKTIADLATRMTATESKVTALAGRVTALEAASKAQAVRIAELEGTTGELTSGQAGLVSTVATVKSRVDGHDSDLSALSDEVGSMANAMTETDARLSALEVATGGFWPGVDFQPGSTNQSIASNGEVNHVAVDLKTSVNGIQMKGQRAFGIMHFASGDILSGGSIYGSSDTQLVFVVPSTVWGNRVETVDVEYWVEWGGVTEHKTVTVVND